MKKFSILSLSLLTPMLAFAQEANFNEISTFITSFINFINKTVVPLVFVVAFVVFIWGVFQYFIAGASDPEKQGKGKDLVKYSLIGFVLMISIWGIVNILAGGLGLDQDLKSELIPESPSLKN